MFGRSDKNEATPPLEDTLDESPAGKGRPTPTRKDAEAARKAALKGPSDPKARRKIERDQAKQERLKQREALLAGDERALPARDAGPVRGFVRDYVDGRRTLAEYFVIIAVVVLAAGLIRNPTVATYVSYAWFLMLILLVTDMTILLYRLRKQLAQKWPDKDQRRGATFYAAMRALQIRRLRLPPPRVKPGGAPVPPKR